MSISNGMRVGHKKGEKMEIIIKCSDENRGSKNIYGEPIQELVRCKDCKWFHIHKTAIWCEKEEGLNHPQYDRFCSFGEMREGDN